MTFFNLVNDDYVTSNALTTIAMSVTVLFRIWKLVNDAYISGLHEWLSSFYVIFNTFFKLKFFNIKFNMSHLNIIYRRYCLLAINRRKCFSQSFLEGNRTEQCQNHKVDELKYSRQMPWAFNWSPKMFVIRHCSDATRFPSLWLIPANSGYFW